MDGGNRKFPRSFCCGPCWSVKSYANTAFMPSKPWRTLAPISHSLAEEDEVCSNWELRESFAGAVVLLIRFSLGRQFFLTPRLFRRTPYHRLT